MNYCSIDDAWKNSDSLTEQFKMKKKTIENFSDDNDNNRDHTNKIDDFNYENSFIFDDNLFYEINNLDQKNINIENPYLEQRNINTEQRNINTEQRNINTEQRNINTEQRNPYLEQRNINTEQRNPYLDQRNPYLDQKNPYLDQRNPYLDQKNPYLDERNQYLKQRNQNLEQRNQNLEPRNMKPEETILTKTNNYHNVFICDDFLDHLETCKICRMKMRKRFKSNIIEKFDNIVIDNKDTILLFLVILFALIFCNLLVNIFK